jgi:serine/threonine-protein kinase
MKCPKCNTENPGTSSYCADCGTQLTQQKDTPAVTKTLETPFPQLTKGTSLANRYKIIEELGKGGMGEVYLAEDTNLKRQVAIKVLPQPFALDKERLARFEREARLLASLNHPNIATIHGLEKSDGQQFLVMELVEGETLTEQIQKGPLPVEEALEVCRQIAEGLESAHEKGIIHRDLKPSNVQVTPEGKVKILDFGLAKAFLDQPGVSDLSKSPAITEEMTRPGVILGTAAYMSPEQAKGKSVDKRTDIWAFGCILYECLTGNRVFKGETISETLASILKDEPDLSVLPGTTPLKIQDLIRRCLVKDPRDRLHDIADARIFLAEVQQEPEATTITTGTQLRSSSRLSWVWLIICLVVGIGIGALVMHLLLPRYTQLPGEPQKQSHFTFELDEREQIALDMDVRLFDISDNGETIAWIAHPNPERKIFYRSLKELEVNAVPGTTGVGNVDIALSPDGTEISFVRDGALWRMPLKRGTPQKLFEGPAGFSIWEFDWGKDGSFVISPAYSGLLRLAKPGADPVPLTTLDDKANEFCHMAPLILPNERGVLFSVGKGNFWNTHIEVLVFDRSEARRQRVLEDVYFVEYVPSGHLLFGRAGTIFAAPFDLKTMAVTGPQVPIISNVQMDRFGMVVQFAISQNGTLAYIPEQGLVDNQLAWIDRQGRLELLPFPSQPYTTPRISRLGNQVAISSRRREISGWKICLLDLRRTIIKELSLGGRANYCGAWSSNGSQIAVSSDQDGPINPYLIDIMGTISTKKLITSNHDCIVTSWSKDGQQLIYTERLPLDKTRIMSVSIGDLEHKVTSLTPKDINEMMGVLSPDGMWMAYVSDQEGQPEVYIRNMDGSVREKVSSAGGEEPAWSPDGKELYYTSKDGAALLSIKLENGTGLKLGKEAVVFKEPQGFEFLKPGLGSSGRETYDVHPDGQRFLFVVKKKREQKMKVDVILNFFEELKRKVPIGK